MKRPPQKVHIIYGGRHYAFDGVVKLDHQHQLDILEEYKKEIEEKEHKNFSMLKPSMLTMEAIISDSMTAQNEPLTGGNSVRSTAAYQNLYRMQRSRDLMTVVTRMFTFTNMLIETFSVTEDLDQQNQMFATIVFKEMIVTAPAVSSPAKSNAKPRKRDRSSKTKKDQSALFRRFSSHRLSIR